MPSLHVNSVSMDDVKQLFDFGELLGEYLAGNQFMEACRFVDPSFADGRRCPSLAMVWRAPGPLPDL